MPRLILMRHAKSDWADAALTDHDRPLNGRGRRDAPMMARWLIESGWSPDVVLHSSARRCVETIDLMTDAGLPVRDLQNHADLYLATAESMLGSVAMRTGTTMVLGHNPGMSVLASMLANQTLEMPTASICVFEYDADRIPEESLVDVPVDSFNLAAYMRPKLLLKEWNIEE